MTIWRLVSLLFLAFGGTFATGLPHAEAEEEVFSSMNVASSNNSFALDLLKLLSNDASGNVFFSPYSIMSVFGPLLLGSRGNTAAEIAKTFHISLDESQHEKFRRLDARLREVRNSGELELRLANGVWAQGGYPIKEDFRSTAGKFYESEFGQLDFRNKPEESRTTLNKWVEERTAGRIRDLFARRLITPITRLVLANAVYFKAKWTEAFNKDLTKEDPFWLSETNSVNVPMMHAKRQFRYSETEDLQLVTLPYKGQVSMVVVLPKKRIGLATLVMSLSASALAELLESAKEQTVDVALPLFRLETDMNLIEPLRALGLKDAFTSAADFSGIEPARELSISAVAQKTFIEVNEEGTEAAAATGVVMRKLAMIRTEPRIFRADHPFVFFIMDEESKVLLFLGEVRDPR